MPAFSACPWRNNPDTIAPVSPLPTNDEDPLGVRRDFPVTEHGIYFDSAYIGPPPTAVRDAGIAFLESKSSAPVSLPAMQERAAAVRAQFARFAGAEADEIALLFCASEGENIVARALDLKAPDNVVIDELHYLTTFVLYRHLSQTSGIELRVAGQKDGRVTPASFEALVDHRTRLISVSWVSHKNGFCHDVGRLAELAHSNGALLYVDATQAAGMLPVQLHACGVDFLVTGTFKWLFAGYGTAPFFVRREHMDRIPADYFGALHVSERQPGGAFRIYDNARKFEYATRAFGAIYQLGAALDYLERVTVARIEAHTVALARRLRDRVAGRGLTVLTPVDNGSAIVSFRHGADSKALRRAFEEAGMHVGFRENGTEIRAGLALFNNTGEIDRFLTVLDRFV